MTRLLRTACWFVMLLWAVPTITLRGNDLPPDSAAPSATDPAVLAMADWQQSGWPLLQRLCLDCHDSPDAEAGLDVTVLGDPATFDQAAGSVNRILEMVRFGAMPPEDAEQPSEAERAALVEKLDRLLYSVSCDDRPRAGKVTARRLNRAEYNHSIRDLFGVDLQPAEGFPSDEVGAGFDNNGDVLSLSPVLMEKYLEAAEQVTEQLILDPTQWPRVEASIAAEKMFVCGEARMDKSGSWFLGPSTLCFVEIDVPTAGTYRLALRGGQTREDDGKLPVGIYDQRGRRLDTHHLPYFGGGRSSVRSERKLQLESGRQRLFIVPLVEGVDQDAARVAALVELDQASIDQARARQEESPQRHDEVAAEEFPFLIRQLDVRGPSEYSPTAFPDHHNRIVVRSARQVRNRWNDVEASALACLKPLARRAFRMPVTDHELEPYVELVVAATERGESYYEGLRIGVAAILVSPRFLFRVETPPADGVAADEDGATPLTQHQLATRLSYFLWSSLPDEPLLADADQGKLTGDMIPQQVRRMLADPKSEALATEFAAQWFALRNLQRHEADTERFAAFTPALRDAMKRETELLFLHMVRQNRPIGELLSCDFTFVNAELAKHYGLDGIEGDQFQQVSLAALPRRGVLSHAGVLTLTSNPERTSPVRRGKWIMETILGMRPPDPPAGVPELEATQTADETASLRARLELHRADPACASCHRVMDQLGFGLERFDAVGGWRDQDAGKPVDASGELPGGESFDGPVELGQILAQRTEQFATAAVERLLTFALGRELTPDDRCTVAEIVENTKNNGYRWHDLMIAVAQSRPFQYYEH